MGYSCHDSSNPTSPVTTSSVGQGGEGAPMSFIGWVRQLAPSAEEEATLFFVLELGPQVSAPSQCPSGLPSRATSLLGVEPGVPSPPAATSPRSLQDDPKGKFIRGKGMKRILFNSTYWARELPDRKRGRNWAPFGHGKLVWLRTSQSGQETSGSCMSQLNRTCPSSLSFLSPRTKQTL